MELQLMEFRKKRGYSNRDDFARDMGVSPATYKSWETGQRKIKLEDACKVADFLGCSLDELAGRWEYVGRFSDDRQQRMNRAFGRLDDSQKSMAASAVEGMASEAVQEKTTREGPDFAADSA